MDFKNFVEKLDMNMSSSYIFEEFLIELLDIHIQEQNKIFISNPHNIFKAESQQSENNRFYDKVVNNFDVFAPEGFDKYIGPTAIEIKMIKNSSSLKLLINKTVKNIIMINTLNSEKPIQNLIIIISKQLSNDAKKHLEQSIKQSLVNLYIWDVSDVQKILNKHKKFKFETKFSKMLGNQISNIEQTYIVETDSTRNQRIADLKEQFNSDNLVLFLGAGISLDAGIPTWNNLMSNLMVNLLDELINSDNETDDEIKLSPFEKEILIKEIQMKNGSSPLQLVRFIRNSLNEKFQDKLKEILYENCKNESSILESIANLSVPLRHGVGIQGIVTYNFDDLIEKQLISKKVINFRSVFQEANMPLRNELGIFHVHGYLPEDTSAENELADDVKIQKNTLVFSEEKYHELLLDEYHWANLVQLNYFRERTCLFIGVSMTDPNVRRLLEIAKRKQSDVDQCNHYIILKRDSFSETNESADINKENIIKFSNAYHALKEVELKELGLNIIWVKEHSEIPSLLDSLRA